MIEIKAIASGSKGNCYRITDGKTALLLEAGLPFKNIQRALNFKTADIKGVLITHEHQDHAKGVKDLIKNGKNVYMTEGTANEILNQDEINNRVKIVTPLQTFTIGTWTILPFDIEHDVAEPVGFLLANQNGEKLLFATDTYFIKYRFKNLTHIMVECNYSIDILNQNIAEGRTPKALKKRLIRSHFSSENVKEFLKANDLTNVEEIHLIHLSDSNSNEREFKSEIERLTGKIVIVH